MDIPRKSRKVRKIVIRVIAAVITAVAIGAITLGLSRLEPASPTVERQTLLIDSVKRGGTFSGTAVAAKLEGKAYKKGESYENAMARHALWASPVV